MNLFRRSKTDQAHRVRHPLMQDVVDSTLPYVVATDHAIWGSFKDIYAATHLFRQVVAVEPRGNRVFLLAEGKTVSEKRGTSVTRRKAWDR